MTDLQFRYLRQLVRDLKDQLEALNEQEQDRKNELQALKSDLEIQGLKSISLPITCARRSLARNFSRFVDEILK